MTLPESLETATGALATATELRVDVTDASASKGSSAPLDLWVDSTAPTIALTSPANLCGSFHQAFATFDTDIAFTTDTPNVTATITNGGTTDTLTLADVRGGHGDASPAVVVRHRPEQRRRRREGPGRQRDGDAARRAT